MQKLEKKIVWDFSVHQYIYYKWDAAPWFPDAYVSFIIEYFN